MTPKTQGNKTVRIIYGISGKWSGCNGGRGNDFLNIISEVFLKIIY